MIKTSVLAFLISIVFSLSAQFQISTTTQANESKWFIKYTGPDSVKLTSASMRFFHHSAAIVFTPSISNPGGGKYQYTGSFGSNGKYIFRFKTVQIPAMDALLKTGDSALLSTTTNTGDTKDTIIISGVKIYYSQNSIAKSADAFPVGINPCPSEAVFFTSGSSNSGIKMGSATAPNLHSGVCETQLVAVVFDAITLSRKPVNTQTPHCASGRLWTTFGNASDQQVYYTFDISTSLGRLQFDTFANAVSTGDYVAITNTQLEPLENFNLVSGSLEKLGFANQGFSSTTGYLNILGKKGANAGEAAYDFCQDSHGVCYSTLEHSMVQNDLSNSIQDYSICYENYAQILDKASINNRLENTTGLIQIYPNPTQDGWHIAGIGQNTSCELLTLSGIKINLPQVCVEGFLSAKEIPTGTYVLLITDESRKLAERRILLRN